MEFETGIVRPVPLAALGQRYRGYRLADPLAEEAMAASLRRWGQLSPVVACRRGEAFELLDGFKRWAAAPHVGLTTLSGCGPARVPGYAAIWSVSQLGRS